MKTKIAQKVRVFRAWIEPIPPEAIVCFWLGVIGLYYGCYVAGIFVFCLSALICVASLVLGFKRDRQRREILHKENFVRAFHRAWQERPLRHTLDVQLQLLIQSGALLLRDDKELAECLAALKKLGVEFTFSVEKQEIFESEPMDFLNFLAFLHQEKFDGEIGCVCLYAIYKSGAEYQGWFNKMPRPVKRYR